MSFSIKKTKKKQKISNAIFNKREKSQNNSIKQNAPINEILNLQKSIGNQGIQKLFESKEINKVNPISVNRDITDKEKKQQSTKPSIPNTKKSPHEFQINDIKEVIEQSKTKKTPINPHEDKAFQSTIKYIKKIGKIQKSHPSPEKKLTEVKGASFLSQEEQQKNFNQADHFRAIEQTSKSAKQKKFTPDTFKSLLKKDLDKLESSLPHNKEDAEDFKNSKPLKSLKENISVNIKQEKENIAGPLEKDTKVKNPPKSPSIPIIAKPIPKVSRAKIPKPINKKAVTPKPLNKSEISMKKESDSLDDLMQENNISESQLANSNEPTFLKALKRKNKAQKELKQAPIIYRKNEEKILSDARDQAAISGKNGLNAMFLSKASTFKNIFSKQVSTEKNDKKEQKRINAEFEKIYNKTKKSVTDKLKGISISVDKYFADGGLVDKAKKTFEKNVEDKLDDIISWTDIFFGKDTKAIEKVFVTEKNKFVNTLNSVFDKIAIIISDGLNEAMKIIDDGRKKSKEYYDGLDKEQKKLAKDTLATFNDKYDNLEESVNAKERELAQHLVKQYQKNVNSLRKTFESIKKKVSTSWLDGAINAIKEVIETIKKLKELISTLLSEIKAFLPVILTDPIGFAKKLFGGIKDGIRLFKINIKKHLLGGFVKWLTGAMGSLNITIPDNIFSLKGIFSLVMQILGLGWDYLRKKAVKMLGEPIVKAMETSVKLFQIIRTKGIEGIWEYLKDKFNDLKSTIIDAIQEMLITKVIVAGIKWLVSLLIPGAGFIKAVLAIKDIIVFFVESAIMLIPTLIESIRALASGNVTLIAKAVEKGLSLLIALVINLFAKLIGLGGLAKKVIGIIERIRKRIDKAIDKLILKARKAFKGLIKKGKTKVKSAVGKVIQWWKTKRKFKGEDNKSHTIFFKGRGKNAKLMLASIPKTYTAFIESIKVETNNKKLTSTKNDAINISTQLDKRIKDKITIKNNKTQTKQNEIEKQKDIDKLLTNLIPKTKILLNLKGDLPSSQTIFQTISKEGTILAKRMEAKILSSKEGNSKGSKPRETNKIYEALFLRKEYYVRGHMLNHNVHGPGTLKNLTPLSQKGNSNHLHEAEKSIKIAINAGSVINYTVSAQYGRVIPDTTDEQLKNAKVNSDQWENIKKIRKAEKYVPTSLTLGANILKKRDSKWVKDRTLIAGKSIINPIDTNLQSYDTTEHKSKKRVSIITNSSKEIYENSKKDVPNNIIIKIQEVALKIDNLRYFKDIENRINQEISKEALKEMMIIGVKSLQKQNNIILKEINN